MLNESGMAVNGETARRWREVAESGGLGTNDARIAAILAAFPAADPLQVSRFVGYAFPLVVAPPEPSGLVALAARGDLAMERQLRVVPPDLTDWIINFRQGTEQERWTPAHAAECFAAACGGHVRIAEKTFTWNGKRWVAKEHDAALRDWLDHFLKVYGAAASLDSPKLAKPVFFSGFLTGALSYLSAKKELRAEMGEFDAEDWLLNTPEGILDLRTGEMGEHDRGRLMTKMTEVGPMPQEEFAAAWEGSRFRRFLEEVFEGNWELIDWTQRMLGYAITGDTSIHAMQFWTGTGRNGKSTLGELLMKTVGDYAAKVPNKLLATSKYERHPTEIAMLQGLRIAIASEVSSNEFFDVEKIKELTGDEMLTARFMRKDFFQFRRTHKFIVYGNSNPRISSADPAFAARLKVLKFMRNFEAEGRMDAMLPKVLEGERSLVLRWLAMGAAKLYAEGKKMPECAAVKTWTGGYMSEHDSVANWWRDMVTVVPKEGLLRRIKFQSGETSEITIQPRNIVTAQAALYKSYTAYVAEHGYSKLGGAKFTNKLEELMLEAGCADAAEGIWCWDAKNLSCGGFRRRWCGGVMLAESDPAILADKERYGREDARSAKVTQYYPWFYGTKDQAHGVASDENAKALRGFFELEF